MTAVKTNCFTCCPSFKTAFSACTSATCGGASFSHILSDTAEAVSFSLICLISVILGMVNSVVDGLIRLAVILRMTSKKAKVKRTA